jgi:hypothetical protein
VADSNGTGDRSRFPGDFFGTKVGAAMLKRGLSAALLRWSGGRGGAGGGSSSGSGGGVSEGKKL